MRKKDPEKGKNPNSLGIRGIKLNVIRAKGSIKTKEEMAISIPTIFPFW